MYKRKDIIKRILSQAGENTETILCTLLSSGSDITNGFIFESITELLIVCKCIPSLCYTKIKDGIYPDGIGAQEIKQDDIVSQEIKQDDIVSQEIILINRTYELCKTFLFPLITLLGKIDDFNEVIETCKDILIEIFKEKKLTLY